MKGQGWGCGQGLKAGAVLQQGLLAARHGLGHPWRVRPLFLLWVATLSSRHLEHLQVADGEWKRRLTLVTDLKMFSGYIAIRKLQ